MSFVLDDRDYSLEQFSTTYTPQDSIFKGVGGGLIRGIGAGLSLAPEALRGEELDTPLKTQDVFDYALDGLADRAKTFRLDQDAYAKKQGLAGQITYGLSYGLSGFLGSFGNPALYGKAMGQARTQAEIAGGVDRATAAKIGAVEGISAGVGSVLPFFGKTLAQRLGFGVAAGVIPGVAQRAAEVAVYGDKYASKAPDVFDPVALAVDSVLGGAFGGLAHKFSSAEINEALEKNVAVKQADNSPGMPTEKGFAIQQKIMDEMIQSRLEFRKPDFTPLLEGEFKDSPEQIRLMQEALDEIEAWRGESGEVKMIPSEVAEARRQVTGVEVTQVNDFLSAKSESGQVGGKVRDGAVYISFAEVNQPQKGEGGKLYRELINTALKKGLRVFSDKAVSADAVKVYESLQRRGYEVKDMTAGRLEDGAAYGQKDQPAFEVVSAPSRVDTIALENEAAMKIYNPDYAAIQARTQAVSTMKIDNFIEEAMTGLDPEATVMIDGKKTKVADLLEDDSEQEATAMTKLVECMLNVR